MAQDVPQIRKGSFDAMIGVDIDFDTPSQAESQLHSDGLRRVSCRWGGMCCNDRGLTVRGESGNRHSRREAGGRKGVTTLQHGLAADLLSLVEGRNRRENGTRVRPSRLFFPLLRYPGGKIL